MSATLSLKIISISIYIELISNNLKNFVSKNSIITEYSLSAKEIPFCNVAKV